MKKVDLHISQEFWSNRPGYLKDTGLGDKPGNVCGTSELKFIYFSFFMSPLCLFLKISSTLVPPLSYPLRLEFLKSYVREF